MQFPNGDKTLVAFRTSAKFPALLCRNIRILLQETLSDLAQSLHNR